MATIEQGTIPTPNGADASALVIYVRAIGLEEGDLLTLELDGPGGAVLAKSAPPMLDHSKDQYMMFVGIRRPAQGWADKTFSGVFIVKRQDKVLSTGRRTIAF